MKNAVLCILRIILDTFNCGRTISSAKKKQQHTAPLNLRIYVENRLHGKQQMLSDFIVAKSENDLEPNERMLMLCGIKLNKQKQKTFFFSGEKKVRKKQRQKEIVLSTIALHLVGVGIQPYRRLCVGRESIKYTLHKCDETFSVSLSLFRALDCLLLIVSIALVCKWLMHEHVVVERTTTHLKAFAPGLRKHYAALKLKTNKGIANYY